MTSSPIFRRITLTEVKKTSNKRGSILKEIAALEREEREILKNHHDPSYSNWRASFLIDEGMNTSGFMQSTLTSQGDTNLETIEGNVEASYQAYEGGSDALSNTAITSSGTGSGTDGGFDLGKDYLGFNGNSTPRYAALKPIDASKFDTLVVTGIRGNDSNGGEDPDEVDEDLMIYYQLPGETTIQRLDYSGGVQQSGVEYKIIPVGSGDGTLKDWSIGLPSYARAENIRFILYQPTHHGTGFDNYGITQINYRRTSPLTVFVSLDSPEASAFIRTGSPSRASQSKKQREKQLREQLEASKDYTDKKFGENFPGSTTPAPGEEDPTEQEKRAPRLGEFEPEVVDYNTWKQETEEENPQAKTSEAEYQKYVDTIEKEKSFAALRSDQQPSAPEAAPVIKTDSEGKVDFNDFKQIQIKKEVTKLNTAITTEIKEGDNEGALKDVDKILKVQPDNAEAKLMKATVERRLGDTESADKDQSEGLKDYAKNPDWNVPELKAPSEIESQQKTEAQTLVQGLIDGDEEIISELKPEEQSAYREFMQRLKDQGEWLGDKFSELATASPPFISFLLQNAGITTHTEENPRVVPLPSNVTTDVKNTINSYLNNNVDPKDWSNLSQKDLKALNTILEDTMGQEYWKTVGQIGRPDAFAEHIKVDDQGNPYVDGLSDTYTFQSKYEDALGDAYFGLPDKLIRLTSGLNPNMDTPYEYTLESGEKIPIANMPMQVNFSDDKPDLTQSIQNVIKNPELLDTISQAGNQVADQVKDGLETFVDNASEAISAMAGEFMMDLQPLTSIPGALNAAHVATGYAPYWIGVSNLTNSPLNTPSILTPQSEIDNYAEMLGVSWFDGNNYDGPNAESIQIPIVSVPKPYADDWIVVNPDGSISTNDGTHDNRTGFFPGGGGTGNAVADRGQAQLQVVIPHDGSEPYVLYTDWAYYNTDAPQWDEEGYQGEVQKPLQPMATAVTDLSNWIHGRPPGGENTGGMAGFPSNIRGAVSMEHKIPLSSLPIESQEYIRSSELYQTRDNPEVVQYYDNLDKTPPGAPQSWDLMNTEQKVHWLDNHQDNLITSEIIEKEPIDDLTPEQISELTPEEQVAAELTPFEHQSIEAQLEAAWEENPEYIDQMIDNYFDSPEQLEYQQETADLYQLIKKEKSEAYSKWTKEKNAKADKLWDEYLKWDKDHEAFVQKKYDEYWPSQEWYYYPEYLAASDKEKPAAARAAKAKAAQARKDYFAWQEPINMKHYEEADKRMKEYQDQRVIKTGEYEEYLAKNPNHNKKEKEAQKKLDSMIAANTLRLDAYLIDLLAEYYAGQNYGPPQGWPTNPDEYQDFDVSQTDQLIASASTDAQELRWILNSGIPLTEKQRNDLIDRINGIKKSEGGLDPLGNIASNIPRGDSVPIDPKTGQPYPYGPTQFPGGNPQAKISAKQTDGSVLTPTDAALVAGGNYAPYYTDFETQTAQNVLQNAPDDWDPVEEYGPGSKADAQQMDNYLNSLPPAVLDDLKNPAKPDHNLLNLMLAMTAGGRVINQLGAAAQAIERFWNKGKDARVKGEDTASWKDLWKDDRAQLGRSDANFQAGKPGNPLGRPDQAFNPFRPADKGGFLSAPTPLVRQVGGRLTKPGMALGSQLNPDGTPRTAQQIQGTDAGAEVGTAQQPFGGGPPEPVLDRETGDPGTRKPPEVPRDEITSMAPPEGWPTDPDAYVDFDLQQKTGGAVDSVDPAAYPGGYWEKYNNDPEFAARMDALDADIEKFSGEEAAARKELRNLAIKFGWDVATTIFGGFVIGGAVRAVQGITAMNKLRKAAQLAQTLRATQGLSKTQAASKANQIINQAMKIPVTKKMGELGLSTKVDDAANALWSSMHKSTDPATKAAANALARIMDTGSDDAVNAAIKAIEKDVYGYGQRALKAAASVVDDIVIKGVNSIDDIVANMDNLNTSVNKTYKTLLKVDKQLAREFAETARDMAEISSHIDPSSIKNFNSALKRLGEIAAAAGLTLGGAIAGEHDLELAQNLEDQDREKLEAEFEAAYEENPEFFDEKFDIFFNSAEEKEFDLEATKLYDELKVAKKVGKEAAEKAKMDAYRAYNSAKWGGYKDDKGKWIPNPDASADKGWLAGGTEDLFKRAEMPEEYKEYKQIMKDLGKQASTSKGDLAWAEEQPAAKEARKVYDDYQKVLDKLSDERAAAYDAVVSFLQALPPHPIHKGILDCDIDCLKKKIGLEDAAKEAAAKEDEGYDTSESLWKSYLSTRNSLIDDRMSLWNKKNEIYNKAQDKVKEMIEKLKKAWEDAKKNATKPQSTTKEDEIQAQIDDVRDQQRVRLEAYMMQIMAEYYASEGMQPPEGYGDPDSDEYFEFDLFSSPDGEKESPFPEDPASDAVGGLGAKPGDELAWGTKKPKGPPTTKTRRGATDATAASTGMYPTMTPEIFKDKYGMSWQDYLKLPQFGQQSQKPQSFTGSGTQIAMNQGPSTPVKYDKGMDRFVPNRGGAGVGPGSNVRPKFPQAKRRVPQQDFGSVADVYGGQGVDAATLASVAAQTQGGRGVKPKKKKLSRTPVGIRPQTNLPTGGRGSAPTPVATQTQGSQGVKPIKPMKPIKKKLVRSSYKPNGSIIIEKRQLKSPNQFFNPDDIKPDYPKDPPPEMVNNYHPDLADGEKVSQRFNKLDPASAKAMPKTGNPHIDAKVEKAKNNPDKDGPAWHKKVTDKIRKARAQQRTGTGQSNGDDSNGNGGEG